MLSFALAFEGVATMQSDGYAANLSFELRKRGLTLAMIADEVGCSKSFVSKILKQQRKNEEVELFVAEALGIPVDQLWQLEFRDSLVSTCLERKEGDLQNMS